MELSWALDRYCDLALKLMSLELSLDDCNFVLKLMSWSLERYCDLALKLMSWVLQLAPHHPHTFHHPHIRLHQDLSRGVSATFSDLAAAELEDGGGRLRAFSSAMALGLSSSWAALGHAFSAPWRLSRRNAWPYCHFKGIHTWPCSPFMAFLGPPPGLCGNFPQRVV